ncbi:hypothetical protein [Oscillatoria salina]|uniref:hypothetical protein n=1 Tax=Oscillatoria salina TaxID=331517 RepID=UPI0013BC8E42|nr:hypothetical protein [Oscillatoria salina]MBZ8179116.1 hypothetical protein [Oscillatoria salina IIICB1]NET87011.1 hypothetical protein [Kamptonema sp. SIO1D9]
MNLGVMPTVASLEDLQSMKNISCVSRRRAHIRTQRTNQGVKADLRRDKAIAFVFVAGLILSTQMLESLPAASNTTIKRGLIPTKQAQFPTKTFEGFDPEPIGCDVSQIQGWFYWYRTYLGECVVIPVANGDRAVAKAEEILEASFSVVATGYGLRN